MEWTVLKGMRAMAVLSAADLATALAYARANWAPAWKVTVKPGRPKLGFFATVEATIVPSSAAAAEGGGD